MCASPGRSPDPIASDRPTEQSCYCGVAMKHWHRFALAMLASALAGGASAQSWPDDFVGRLEVLAVIENLNGALLASRSATATLESWCADHHMASPARLTAVRDRGADSPASPADRALLQIGPREPVKYRRVALACGSHILSQAENWYVPARLSPQMNRLLETGDTPFGRAVADLHPFRQTLSSERLWSPLPAGWELWSAANLHRTDRVLSIPPMLFRHRALLVDSQHRPIAEVVETYTR